MSLSKAKNLYSTFHQFEPTSVGEFSRQFEIPSVARHVGKGKTMLYTSDKLNPESGRDEGYVSYFHTHEDGVKICVTDESVPGRWCRIPRWIREVEVLVLLGQCDGYEFENFEGELQEARAVGRRPEWYCVPSGKALLVVQDKRSVLALVWGESLRVEWRGVVG